MSSSQTCTTSTQMRAFSTPPAASQMAENTRTLRSIQVARAVAALLVVMHHLSLRFEQQVTSNNFLGIFDHIGFAGVDLFFVISGLIMVITCQRHFGRCWAALPFLWRRATRIFPVYWLFTIVQLIAILLIPSATSRSFTTENLVASLLLLPQSVYPILAPGWTLTYEMFFYLVFALLFIVPPRFTIHVLSIWGLATVSVYAFQATDGMSTTTDLLSLPLYGSPMTLEFIAGCVIGLFYNNGVTRFAKTSLVMGAAWFAGGWVIVESITTTSAEFGMTRVLVFGVASTLILYGLLAHEKHTFHPSIRRGIFGRGLMAIGDASYSLYLSHLLVINFFAIVWQQLAINGWVSQLLFESMILVTCIGFAIATYRFIEQPILNRMRRD